MELKLLDLDAKRRPAFLHGLVKGLAAPLMLFAYNRADIEVPPMPEIPTLPQISLPASILELSDLQRIGVDFRKVVARYDESQGEATEQFQAV